jgi:predicted branched-subunit amino acid permease
VPAAPPTTPPDERAVVRQAVSVSVATGLYGLSLGALAVVAGLSVWQAVVLSLLMFSGGSQFALVGIVGTGGSAASAVATAGLLGIRNGFYGVQLSPLLAVRSWRRVLAAHLTIDESTAVAVSQREPAHQRLGFWITGGAIFLVWNLTTLLGALAGDAIGDPRRYGLDAAAAGAFLGLLWPRLRAREPVAVAVAAAVLAAVLVPVLPVGLPVVAAAGVAVAAGLRRT